MEYEVSSLRKPESFADLGRDCLSLHHIFGFDVSRRENWCLIEPDKVLFASGSSVVIQNIKDGSRDYLLSIDDQGVGCIAVHPSKKYFAVGGKGYQPCIYIYSYPELKVCKVLKDGAERGYACMDFSADGQKLASVSTNPDYMLTIWDWEEETMGLHSKAFGQDVWNVKFSADDPRRLTTSGIGHIRFWKMAATFTGLKLQGSIGKFGKVDLSDIEHFVELPDGKVVSGTEDGSLLLWEGNFIKCRFVQVNKAPCHAAPITYLQYDRKEKCIISGSSDGFIRWWDFGAIDSAEVDADHSMDFELLPLAEYQLSESVGIKTMLDGGLVRNARRFLFVDTSGKGQVLAFTWRTPEAVTTLCDSLIKYISTGGSDPDFSIGMNSFDSFHSGSITGMDTCPARHLVASCGKDGSVYCMNYRKRKVLVKKKFDIPACSLKWLPSSLDKTGSSFAVGFDDGTVKLLTLIENSITSAIELKLTMVFKPHNAKVVEMSFSDSGSFLATSSAEGTIFFFRCQSVTYGGVIWDPLYFVDVSKVAGGNKIYSDRLTWDREEKRLLITSTDAVLRELDVSAIIAENSTENQTSFEMEVPYREISASVNVKINPKAGTLEIIDPASADTSANPNPNPESNENADNTTGNATTTTTTKAKGKDENKEEIVPMNLRMIKADYSLRKESNNDIIASVVLNQSQAFSCEIDTQKNQVKQIPSGLYSMDGKSYWKFPNVTTYRYGWSKKFLSEGLSDGGVILRPSKYFEIFCRYSGHNGAINGVSITAISYDDNYVFSAGRDGCLVVFRIHQDIIEARAKDLHADIEAGVFAGEVTKPIRGKVTEPDYLNFVSSSEEDDLPAIDSNFMNEDTIPDVEDLPLSAYSIQDNRLKLEQDAKKSAAEDLKSRVLASVRTLRKDYEKILKENENIPETVRLKADELMVDNNYFALANEMLRKAIDEIHLENAYNLEKSEAQLKKLKNHFMNGLLMEEIPITTFQPPENTGIDLPRKAPSTVWSLRITALNPMVKEIISQVKAQVRMEELKESQQRSNELAQKKAMSAMDEMKQRLQKKGEEGAVDKVDQLTSLKDKHPMNLSSTLSATLGESDKGPHESTAVIRRSRRKERKEELKRHDSEKPDEHADDVRDLEAIKIAEKTIGDYKLKSAEDYEVPEDQRINAIKKIRQLAMLEDSMMMIRLAFNEKFLTLRQLKRDIIFSILKDNDRIKDIDRELNQRHLSNNLWQPSLDPKEFPDDFDEVTESELSTFIDKTRSTAWNKLPTPEIPTHHLITGKKLQIIKNIKTNSFEVVRRDHEILSNRDAVAITSRCVKKDSEVNQRPVLTDNKLKYYEVDESLVHSLFPTIELLPPSESAEEKQPESKTALEDQIPLLMFTKSLLKQRMTVANPSKAQVKLNEQRRIKLQFERSMIQRNMVETITAFHEAVDDLRLQRHQIISDLKLAEFKLLTLFQEYLLLQTFESRDNLLQQKQIKNKTDEKDNSTLMYENRTKLESKTEEIQHWNEKLAALTNEFKTILPDSHPYYDILSKIFRKRVKRNKNTGEEEDEDNNDDDQQSDDENDDEDDDELEEVEDICPPGCDQLIFEKILDLREKKLDTEEVCSDISKSIDELKRTNERLKQREKQISKETQQTEYEVTQFQLQKQAALNQIRVVVPLRLSQLFTFESSGALTGPSNDNIDNRASIESLESKDSSSSNNKSDNLDKRNLFSSLRLKTHTLFSTKYVMHLGMLLVSRFYIL